MVDEVADWGECVMGEGVNDGPEKTETLVFARDRSNYRASLSTRKDFGCVLHPRNIAADERQPMGIAPTPLTTIRFHHSIAGAFVHTSPESAAAQISRLSRIVGDCE